MRSAEVVLILDESLLVADGTPLLLRRLRHSNLRLGVHYQDDDASRGKDTLLERLAVEYSLERMPWKVSSTSTDDFNRLLPKCNELGGICIYATSFRNEDLFVKLSDHGWRIILKSGEVGLAEKENVLVIDKLEELPFAICRFNKLVCNKPVVTVGYIMKTSRESDFLKRGAFPMHPTQNGLMFVPITFELPFPWQIQEVDMILHKATDEIIRIEPSQTLDSSQKITFSEGIQQLQRFARDHPSYCIIDPLDKIYPLVDRLRIQEILLGLKSLGKSNGSRIRGAHYLKVDDFHDPDLSERLSEAELLFPNIVKPQVACGVADAHNMALIFKAEHFRDLHVPLPAIVQEYVNHGSVLYKFYVLGEKVFHAKKKSMPNSDVLKLSSEKIASSPITFDSLKSLPIHEGEPTSEGYLDVELVTEAANWLRRKLDLTIFGFDVVIQEGSGDHVIVDLNYLPSFKEVPDDVAIPAFWDAIRYAYELRKGIK